MIDVDKFLYRLNRLGLKINIPKSEFFIKVKEDNFKLLGYEVDKGRIIPNKNKLNILKHFKTPNSVTELQRFRLFDLHQAFNSIESHRFNVCSKPIVIREK